MLIEILDLSGEQILMRQQDQNDLAQNCYVNILFTD